jgi:hypothetical protein
MRVLSFHGGPVFFLRPFLRYSCCWRSTDDFPADRFRRGEWSAEKSSLPPNGWIGNCRLGLS